MKKTLVIGATTHSERYSYLAVNKLRAHGHEVVALGKEPGTIADVNISTTPLPINDLDTVTLYINPRIQNAYYDYIIGLKPNRVIFNPGTENDDFEALLKKHDIKAQEACTLVLLSTGQY